MKNHIFVSCFVVFILFAVTSSMLHAVPIGNSNAGREYLAGASDLGNWSCGLYADLRSHNVDTRWHPSTTEYVSQGGMIYIGYDLVRWITAYVVGGGSQISLGGSGTGSAKYGVGMHFNILDHEIMDPTLFEDRLRLNAGWLATATQAEWSSHGTDIYEAFASLTVSVVNDLEGPKKFVPNSIALYAGPLYSGLFSADVFGKTPLGFTAGLEIFYTERVSFSVGVNQFNSSTMPSGGLHIDL